MSDIARISKLAIEFRNAIESTNFTTVPFQNFPYGCCSDASLLLIEYLNEFGIKVKYHSGQYFHKDSYYSHAWCVLANEMIIDITGDQFSDNSAFLNYNVAVYIGLSDAFHDLFQENVYDDFRGINCCDDALQDILKCQYRLIKENIRK